MHQQCECFFFAAELDVELSFYQGGVMRTIITEPSTSASSRPFQTSKTEGVLTLDNLRPVQDL